MMDVQRLNPCCLDSLQAHVALLRWVEMETSYNYNYTHAHAHVLGFEYDLRYLAATKVRWYDKKYQAGPFYVEMLFD